VPKLNREPVAIVAAVQTLIGSLIGVLVAFNVWNPSEVQRLAIDGLYVALTGIVLMFVRGMVTPNANVGLTKTDIELIEAAQREK
jgi:Na+/H+ antiporter NhaC